MRAEISSLTVNKGNEDSALSLWDCWVTIQDNSVLNSPFKSKVDCLSGLVSQYSCSSKVLYPWLSNPCVCITFLPPPENSLKTKKPKQMFSLFISYFLLPAKRYVPTSLYSWYLSYSQLQIGISLKERRSWPLFLRSYFALWTTSPSTPYTMESWQRLI